MQWLDCVFVDFDGQGAIARPTIIRQGSTRLMCLYGYEIVWHNLLLYGSVFVVMAHARKNITNLVSKIFCYHVKPQITRQHRYVLLGDLAW